MKKIERYTQKLTFEDFVKDLKTVDAVVRNLSVLGEAVKNLPEKIKEKHADVPWSEIMGMRNKVVHEYFAVDEEILWKTVTEDIPTFKQKVEELGKEL